MKNKELEEADYAFRNKRLETFYDRYIAEDETRWCVKIDGLHHWFPKSICTIDENEKILMVPRWLCQEKGLI